MVHPAPDEGVAVHRRRRPPSPWTHGARVGQGGCSAWVWMRVFPPLAMLLLCVGCSSPIVWVTGQVREMDGGPYANGPGLFNGKFQTDDAGRFAFGVPSQDTTYEDDDTGLQRPSSFAVIVGADLTAAYTDAEFTLATGSRVLPTLFHWDGAPSGHRAGGGWEYDFTPYPSTSEVAVQHAVYVTVGVHRDVVWMVSDLGGAEPVPPLQLPDEAFEDFDSPTARLQVNGTADGGVRVSAEARATTVDSWAWVPLTRDLACDDSSGHLELCPVTHYRPGNFGPAQAASWIEVRWRDPTPLHSIVLRRLAAQEAVLVEAALDGGVWQALARVPREHVSWVHLPLDAGVVADALRVETADGSVLALQELAAF